MNWTETIKAGLNCPNCKEKGTFKIKPKSYSTRKKRTGYGVYECSNCGYKQTIG